MNVVDIFQMRASHFMKFHMGADGFTSVCQVCQRFYDDLYTTFPVVQLQTHLNHVDHKKAYTEIVYHLKSRLKLVERQKLEAFEIEVLAIPVSPQ